MPTRLSLDEAADLFAPLVEESDFAMPTLLLGLREGGTTSINLASFSSIRGAIRTLTERVKVGQLAEVQWALFTSEAQVAYSDDEIKPRPAALTRQQGVFAAARASGTKITDAVVLDMVDKDEGTVFHAYRPFVRQMGPANSRLVVWQKMRDLSGIQMDPGSNPVGILLADLVNADRRVVTQ